MSSKKFKSQASSARAASSNFGSSSFGGFGATTAFQTTASPLSYVTELPDLNTISEPKVVVAYKNLSKKDSVTKAKALEELQDYLSHIGESGVENAVLEAWVGPCQEVYIA
jgi:E3 ubiquitin-protein ligase listerin